MKNFYCFSQWSIITILLFLPGCRLGSPDSSNLDATPKRETGPNSLQVSRESDQERQFRDIFASHLKASGRESAAIHHAMFIMPDTLKRQLAGITPSSGSAFINRLDTLYGTSDPTDWHEAGKKASPTEAPTSGRSPITFVILPGFSSEFIAADPFEEILSDRNSKFAKKAGPILEEIVDSVYSVKENKQIKIKLSEVVKVGSRDDSRGESMVNLIMFAPKLGSLESIGTLDSTIATYQRRLDHIFTKISGLGTVYLLGYSRGAIVGLELLRATHALHKQKKTTYPWIERIHGLVSLGGVLYGSELADHAFKDQTSVQSQATRTLLQIVADLQEGPKDLCATPFNPNFRSLVAHNAKVFSQAIAKMVNTTYEPSRGKVGLLVAEEKLRHITYGRTYPGIFANFDQVQKLLFDLINIKSPVACYSDNVRAFKKLVAAVLDGARTLTTEARLQWWRSASLPKQFRILSLSATMPGPVKDQKLSPIIALPYYGYQSPDFIFVQRPSYYVMLENGASDLNDSAVAVHRARYWPQLDPVQGRQYDQLGVLGSHHFGIGFKTAIMDCQGTPNPFPRSELVSSVASYIRQFPRRE